MPNKGQSDELMCKKKIFELSNNITDNLDILKSLFNVSKCNKFNLIDPETHIIYIQILNN